MKLTLALTVALMSLAVLPVAASASVASRSGSVITISGGPESSDMVVASDCCFYHAKITDSAGITAAGECTQTSATEVDCGSTRPNPSVEVSLGDGNDKFTTNELFEFTTFTIDGGPGNDTLAGGTNGDVMHGGDGNDTVNGGGGDDQVFGDAGDDVVNGGTHADKVSGGPGKDRVEGDGSLYNYGDGGSDTIDSRDGEVDQVTCGYGSDIVTADTSDVIEGGGECESVDAQPTTAPPPGGGGGTSGALEVAVSAPKTVKLSKLLGSSGFVFQAAFTGDCRATVKLTVGAADSKRLKLGRRATVIAKVNQNVPAGVFNAAVKPLGRYRPALKRAKKMPAVLSMSCTDATTTAKTSRKVTFKK